MSLYLHGNERQQQVALKLKKAGYNVSDIYRGLYVKRSTFYTRYKVKPINADHMRLTAAMEHVHKEMDETYGSRHMLSELRELGFNVGRYKVRRVMRQLKLVAKRPRQNCYAANGELGAIAPNMLNRQFNPEKINTYWSGDITYIRISKGLLYLAIVMDLYSRKVISWACSDKPNSDASQESMTQHNVISSISRKGNCLDNAVIERFFISLKSERLNYRRYQTRSQAMGDIIDYIEPFYNQKRRHAKLGNISQL